MMNDHRRSFLLNFIYWLGGLFGIAKASEEQRDYSDTELNLNGGLRINRYLAVYNSGTGTITHAGTYCNMNDASGSKPAYKINGIKVVGPQGAAVADATDAESTTLQLNEVLARLRTHGLIAK